jgi:hypothetical protein
MGKTIGKVEAASSDFLMTDRRIHELWTKLTIKRPAASAIMHFLCARVRANSAFVAAVPLIAEQVGVHTHTARLAIEYLEQHNWIQVVNLGKGQAKAYIVNSRVMWQTGRAGMRYALFNATVMASESDQDKAQIENTTPLVTLPSLRKGEIQLPSGDGEAPPSQPQLDGVDLPDTPYIEIDQTDWVDDGEMPY